jgi:soluble lytic murein transglycosylase
LCRAYAAISGRFIVHARDPKVDAVDWVEQIPFSETRNYVQRIMENLQVYRARFGGGTRLQIEADLRRGASVE